MLFQGVSSLTNVSGHGGGSSGESSEIVKQSPVEHMQGALLAVCRDTDVQTRVFIVLNVIYSSVCICETHSLLHCTFISHVSNC